MKPNPESLNQVNSLAGKIDKQAMGNKMAKSRPTLEQKKKNKHHNLIEQPSNIEQRQKNLLDQRFDVTLNYRPRTQQNKLIYENYLGKIYQLVEDQPQDTLISIADQILATLKSDLNEQQKKAIFESIIGEKLQGQKFLNICNLVRNISDYQVQENNQFNQAIIMDQQQEQDEDSQGVIVQQIQEELEQRQIKQISMKRQQSEMKQENDCLQLNANQVDAYWIQSKLSKFYDASQVLKVQKQIMQTLNCKSKLQAQNNLLSILNYEKYDLIKLFLNNREIIFYMTKYHQCANQKQKETILEEMKTRNIFYQKKAKKGQAKTSQKKQTEDPQKMVDQNQNYQFTSIKDEDILRINKKKIDLNIHDTTDRTSHKQQYKFKLPEGAQKIDKPGYQEIKIPARTRKIDMQLIDIDTLPQWMQPVFTGIKKFNPIQTKVLNHTLNTNQNMLVCAPTSAGKTNIALLAILQTISHYILQNGNIDLSKFKIVYIAPMKALVSQITGNLSNRLKTLNVKVKQLTGDMHLTKGQIQETQVIVSTPEKWDIITRKAGDRLFTQKVRLLIIDQIHLLSDTRGPVLQSIIARTIRQVQTTQQQVRIVGLSATLPNYKDVGIALRVNPKQGLFYFDQSYRPIPLEQLFVGITQKKGVRKMMMVNQILYEKVMERVSNQQIIIFVHSRRDTVRTARQIKQTAFSKDELSKILRPQSQSKKILQAIAEKQTINSKDLKQLLTEGIGIHHAGLSRGDRDLVQQLFNDRHLNILVSTATLAWGVNLPAHTVIIKGTQVYSPQEGRWIQISLQDIMQMLGRAGRPKFDLQGQGIIITGYQQIRYYLGLLNMQIPLESQMLKCLPDQLNAQIVLGTISNIKDGVNWLAYTYLYIRMLKNPRHYNITIEQMQEDPQLLKRRVNLIHTAAMILQNNGLIHYDRKNGILSSTFLGKIASYYYIKYSSMAVYNSNLKNNSGLIELFKIFAMSSEFKYLTVREEQKNQLKKLSESVPVPIKGSIQDPTTKISALLQAYISRLQLQGYALNVDKVYVTQSASRIMRGLFQICLKRGWGQAAQKTLQLSKMIDKSMWSCLNPLRQFKQIPQYVLSRLQKKQQFSWQSFYQMNPQQIGDLTKFPKLGKILHKFVHHVPRLQLDAYAQPITRSSLRVDLNVKSDFKWQDQYHGKQQGFWLFVLDCNQQNILFSYYFTLRKNQPNFSMQFIVPLFEILHPLYFIKVISDRWISSDNVLPLSFKNMILPNKFLPPTQLLDLQPLPGSNIGQLAKDLKITYLNQIQTQTFSSFVNSNQNVFLGATEGSGKFTLAVLAMNRVLQSNKKVVLIQSHLQLVKSRLLQLTKVFSRKKVGRTYNQLTKDIVVLANMDIIITTAQSWDVLSRRWKARKGFSDIGIIVINNLHLLSQNYSTMEIVVSRMRSITGQNQNKMFRMIGLSASIADYKQVSQWLGAPPENTYNFHPSVRPNTFQMIFNSYDQVIRQSRIHMMQKNLMQTIKHFNRSNIVFVSSKKQTKLTALDFVTLLQSDQNSKRFRKIPEQQYELLGKKIGDKYLHHVLDYGIGYLYEGMNQTQKQMVIKLFEIQAINILIIQQSLKWSINFKAFLIAVLDCAKFDCLKRSWVDYSIPEMIQFMSMSILSEKDKHKGKQFSSSKFIIMCQSSKKNFYKKFLFQPYPIQSSLHLNLADHLNSSIVSKSIQSKQDCIDWLTWTLFYRRIVHNPNYYNMQEVSEEAISSYLSQLIQNTVQYLSKIKCVQTEDQESQESGNGLTPTNLGIICSYYYIKVQTLGRFAEKVTQNLKLKEILELICQAQQLQFVSYKPKQYQVIGQLLVSICQTAKNKPHALLLLYLNRVNVTPQILYEIRQVLPICIRLIHSLVDIISSFGYLKPIILTMQLCEMIIQAMWVNDSPLMQIMDRGLAKSLEETYSLKSINDFINMEEQDREAAFKDKSKKQVEKIAEACNRYPILSMSHQVLQAGEEEIQLKIILQRDEQLQNQYVHSSYYPQQKQQYWWIIVGEKKSNRVLTTKRTLVKLKSQVTVEFEKMQGVDKYMAYALCDSYLGCTQAQQITLDQSQ